jgi:hypothetical protein
MQPIGWQLEVVLQELQRCAHSYFSKKTLLPSPILKTSTVHLLLLNQLTLLFIQWGIVGLALGTAGHFWSPLFRGLTPQFKVYVCRINFFKS